MPKSYHSKVLNFNVHFCQKILRFNHDSATSSAAKFMLVNNRKPSITSVLKIL